jgi:hypothetical protein
MKLQQISNKKYKQVFNDNMYSTNGNWLIALYVV